MDKVTYTNASVYYDEWKGTKMHFTWEEVVGSIRVLSGVLPGIPYTTWSPSTTQR